MPLIIGTFCSFVGTFLGTFMLARGVNRRRKGQIAIFGYKNPTADVLLHRVSQSLGSIGGSGEENGASTSPPLTLRVSGKASSNAKPKFEEDIAQCKQRLHHRG